MTLGDDCKSNGLTAPAFCRLAPNRIRKHDWVLTRVGPHFLGLMDLTNFIYPLGLAFFGLMLVLAVLHGVHTLAIAWHNVEEFNLQRFNRFSILIVPLAGIPVVLLDQSLETQFYSLLVKVGGIMIVSVMSGFVAFVRYQQNRRKLNARAINFLNFSILWLVASSYGVGLAQAEYQAFRTPTLYKITDKHGFDTVVRIIRASSSGLLVASVDRRIIFVPKEEYRQFERDRPISLNLSE